jgi:hypothetical protein
MSLVSNQFTEIDMSNRDIVYFSVLLFVALVALSHWKARRYKVAARIKRGLISYASGTGTASS